MKSVRYFAFLFVVSALISAISRADCLEKYDEMVGAVKAKQIKNSSTSMALTVATLFFPPAGIAKIGIYAVQSKLSFDGAKNFINLTDLQRSQGAIEQARMGSGKDLEYVHKVVREEFPNATLESVAENIFINNQGDFYCPSDTLASLEDILLMEGVSPDRAREGARLWSGIRAEEFEGPKASIPGHSD